MLKIIRAGIYSTVQDLGRNGLRQLGVSQGGALDSQSLKIANVLVGNPQTAAGLEITLGQFSAEFTQDSWFALSGAHCDATLDGEILWTGWCYPVKAGQRLTLSMPLRGMRSYLAVAGGIAVPEMLGSRSTDLKAAFGGLEGRLLKDGDQLPLGESSNLPRKIAGVKQTVPGTRIRALPGPEYSEFTTEAQNSFWRTPWQLNPQSNRMGFRLQGHALERSTDREMLSHGLIPGVIQVPHNGQPIILMADAQTTGGYPRIACVIEADLCQLAQVRLGDIIHFVPCSLAEARQARLEQEHALRQMRWGLDEG